jgi:choline dehydrogenase
LADFDYVIVGAGSAGCVLAYRLSENPKTRVLLIEAGPEDRSPLIHMPKGFAKLFSDPKQIWHFPVEPEGGQNEPEVWVRGKVLGGSSSVNGMVYMRGQAANYDDWATRGNRGWGWDDMLRCFRAIEDHDQGASPDRGSGGPLTVSSDREPHSLSDAIIAAGEALGLPARADINTATEEGVGYTLRTIRKGRRWSAASAFLKPARQRRNLSLITEAQVEKVLFEGQRAIGVRIRRSDGAIEDIGGREILLSAGTLMSPAILQRSGVGPAALLSRHGITPVAEREQVGENMIEHRMLAMQYRLVGDIGHNREHQGWRLLFSVLRYYLSRTGVLAKASHELGFLLKSRPDLPAPDIQVLSSPVTFRRNGAELAVEPEAGMHFIGHAIQPRSRGRVTITGSDAAALPQIKAGYLTDPHDRQLTVFVTDFIRRLVKQPSLAPLVVEELSPGPAVSTDEDIIGMYHRNGNAGYHAVGTCAMGPEAEAVVDDRLRVRGVSGLRVVDCSVMPTIPSGNTNGPVMALAWRAADFILAGD